MTKIIGITGGKGGTGKSTIATALAVELGNDHKVLLVDMDVDCPNDHLLLNIERKYVKTTFQRIPKWDFDKCTKCGLCGTVCKTNAILSVKGEKPIFMQQLCNGCGACVMICPVNAISWDKKEVGKVYEGKGHGIDLLSGDLKIKEPNSEIVVDAVKEVVQERKKNYDYIIIDTAAGTHCDVISALEGCEIGFAVTEPTPLGAHDLGLIMKLMERLKVPFEIILNKYEEENEDLILRLAEKHGKKVLVKVPYKKEIMEAYSKGEPIKDKNIWLLKEWIKKNMMEDT